MNGRPAMSLALPKPGPALTCLLVATAALGIFTAFFATWVPGGNRLFLALAGEPARDLTQPWRLLTSGLLTSPVNLSHLLFSLVGLYFLSPPLEKRWGWLRFAGFCALSVVMGNLATIAVGLLAPPGAQERFHPALVFGPMAIITGIAVAWSREFYSSTVNLFFVVPMRGKTLLWVTIGFCVLDLIYPEGVPEGVAAPFGGVVAGLLFSGSPSLARSAWLRVRLAVLRRRASGTGMNGLLSVNPARRARQGGPPLRVVRGPEESKKQAPPKDKRYLN